MTADRNKLWSPAEVWKSLHADASVFAGLSRFQIGVMMDELISDVKAEAFRRAPQRAGPRTRKRQRGWWAGLPPHDNNPFRVFEDDDGQIAAKRKQCDRLTQHARLLGAKKNSDAARLIRIRLVAAHGERIRGLGNRGVSALANECAPVFGLAASTLRAHIAAVRRELLTSR